MTTAASPGAVPRPLRLRERLASPRGLAWCCALLAGLSALAALDRDPTAARGFAASWWVLAKVPIAIGDWHPLGRPLTVPWPGGIPLLLLLAAHLVCSGLGGRRAGPESLGRWFLRIAALAWCFAALAAPHAAARGELHLAAPPADGAAVGDRQVAAASFVLPDEHELVLLRDDAGRVEERILPAWELRGRTRASIAVYDGSFFVEVDDFLDDSEVHRQGPAVEIPGAVDGLYLAPREPRAPGSRGSPTPGCRVTVIAKDGSRKIGLLSAAERTPRSRYRAPFVFEQDGHRCGLDLRRVVRDLPFTLQLDAVQPSPLEAKLSLRSAVANVSLRIQPGEPVELLGHVVTLQGTGSVGGADGEPESAAAVFGVLRDPLASLGRAALLLAIVGAGLLASARRWPWSRWLGAGAAVALPAALAAATCGWEGTAWGIVHGTATRLALVGAASAGILAAAHRTSAARVVIVATLLTVAVAVGTAPMLGDVPTGSLSCGADPALLVGLAAAAAWGRRGWYPLLLPSAAVAAWLGAGSLALRPGWPALAPWAVAAAVGFEAVAALRPRRPSRA